MNTIKLAALSFGILFGSVVFAQQQSQLSKHKLSKEQRMEMRQDNLSKDLELTKEQSEKMTVLREFTMKEREKLRKDTSLDASKRSEAIKALNAKQKEEMTKILTTEQATKLKEKKMNRPSNFREMHSKKHPNKKFHKQRKGVKKHNKSKDINANLAPVKD